MSQLRKSRGEDEEADSDFTGCRGEGDTPWEWLRVMGETVANEEAV